MISIMRVAGIVLAVFGGFLTFSSIVGYDSNKEGALLTSIVMFVTVGALPLFGGIFLIRKSKQLKEKQIQEYVDKLKANFPNHWEHILNKQLVQGMTFDMVKLILGEGGDRKESVNKNGKTEKYKYLPYRNRQNNISFKIEVTFENGLVTGWKDL